MSKGRVITGFGPTKIILTAAGVETTGPWLKFGPFSGRTLTAFAAFTDTATSQSLRLDVALTTESTGATITAIVPFGDLTSASGSSFGLKGSSGSTGNYGFIRAYSSEQSIMSTGNTMSVWFIAGNPSS